MFTHAVPLSDRIAQPHPGRPAAAPHHTLAWVLGRAAEFCFEVYTVEDEVILAAAKHVQGALAHAAFDGQWTCSDVAAARLVLASVERDWGRWSPDGDDILHDLATPLPGQDITPLMMLLDEPRGQDLRARVA